MLYKLSHFILNKLPFVWAIIEFINEKLFLLRYGRRLHCVSSCLEKYQSDFRIKEASLDDINPLVAFFEEQPPEFYQYFRPHGFDEKSVRRIVKNKSRLIFLVYENDRIIGYYFLRCFFIGKSYLGKMVNHQHQGKGVGKMMCLSAMEIADLLGMHMYETISKENLSSLYSTQKVLDTKLIKELENNYIYIEDFPKGTLK